MGMFDTFIVQYEGETLQIQSKDLECVLNVYKLGDTVHDKYHTILIEDTYFAAENLPQYVGLIIFNGIFIDYVFGLTVDETLNLSKDKLELLKENPEITLNKMIDFLKQKNSTVFLLNHYIGEALKRFQSVYDFFINKKDIVLKENIFCRLLWNKMPQDLSPENKKEYIITTFLEDIKKEFNNIFGREE